MPVLLIIPAHKQNTKMLDKQAACYYTFYEFLFTLGTTETEEEIDWGTPMGEEVW
jgi:hypothetical protein